MKKKHKIFILIAILLTVLLILLLILLVKYFPIKELKEEALTPRDDGNERANIKMLYDQLGTVQEVNNFFIIIETIPERKLVKGLITQETEIINIIIPERLDNGSFTPEDIREERASLLDIKIGDEVSIVSNQNVNELEEFNALKIRIIKREF